MESARLAAMPSAFWRIVFAGLATLILSAKISTAAEDGPAIGELLKTGLANCRLQSGHRQPINLHPVSASGAKLSRAMPRGLRCDPNSEHLFDLLQVAVRDAGMRARAARRVDVAHSGTLLASRTSLLRPTCSELPPFVVVQCRGIVGQHHLIQRVELTLRG